MRVLTLSDPSQVAEARRHAVALARAMGFGDTDAGRLAIVATELATNVIRHGGGGEMLLDSIEDGAAIQLLALDRGPGMASVQQCLRDGFSTAGSAGSGLGAVQRQSDLLDIHSAPGQGTAILACVRRRGAAPPPPPMLGGVAVPVRGEEACGDIWAMLPRGEGFALLIADGLGHGPVAAEAAIAAAALFRKGEPDPPSRLLRSMHEGLRHTRGCAAAIAVVAPGERLIRFCGVGNIVCSLFQPDGARRMVSHNGTMGHVASRFQDFVYPLTEPGVLVMHSDGIATSLSLDRHVGLAQRHPVLMAAVLYRDHARGRDDATVVVARIGP